MGLCHRLQPLDCAAMSDEDFAALLEEYEKEGNAPGKRGPRPGDMVEGTIISIGAESVFVDLGAKSEGVLERSQVCDAEGELRVKVGDTIEARVVEAGTAGIILRTAVAKGPDAVAELGQAHELGIPVEGLVTATNKGGVEVTVAGLRAFCPVSQLDNRFVEDSETFVGKKLQFKITKLEGGRRPNIVLSRRALLEAEAEKRADELRSTLDPGAQLTGTVTQLRPFGAFVDLGGVEGMLHVSELGHTRVADPSEVLEVGQTVDVVILKIEDAEKPGKPPRISLSRKALMDDPWLAAAADLTAGGTTSGTIVRLQPFGAFVEVRPGVEGLVHISELGAGRRIHHPREVANVGDTVEVTVLSVDPNKRRLSLSMAAAGRASAEREERENIRDNAPRAPKSLGTMGDLFKNVKLDS